jgi:hypothetical protein
MQAIFKKLASWLFLTGILIAVIIGLISGANVWTDNSGYINVILAALGFLVGILSFFALGNITSERVPTFLIAALILVGIGATATWFQHLQVIGEIYMGIASTLVIFAAPAAGLLAIRAIWDAGKTEEIQKVIPKIPNK